MLAGEEAIVYLLMKLSVAVFLLSDEAPVVVDRRSKVAFLRLESDLATPHITSPHGKSLFDPQGKPHPQSIRSLPIDQLHLEAQTHNALVKAGIVTIGALFQAEISYLCDLRGFHLDSFNHINSALTALNNAIREDGSIDWFQYWETREIQVIPSITASHNSIEEFLNAIPQIAEEVLRRGYGKRSWIVIQKRLGLGSTERLTLETIGSAYGLCRERVRQIERNALEILREVLVEQRYGGKDYHVHPVVHQMTQTLRSILEKESSNIILETRLLESICQKPNSDPAKPNSPLLLLMTIMGARCLEVDYLSATPQWGYTRPTPHRILERGTKPLSVQRKPPPKRVSAEKKATVPRPDRLQEKKVAAPRPDRSQKKRAVTPQPADEETLLQEKLQLFQPYLAFYQQIEEYAHSLLDAAPGKQMPVKDLLHHLHQQFEWPTAMISHYFKVTGSIEHIDVPGATKKMCRAKRTIESEYY